MQMKQQEMAPSVLDGVVQKSIANLELSKERISRITGSAQSLCGAVTHEIATTDLDLEAHIRQFAELEQRVHGARRTLDAILSGGMPGESVLTEAVEALADAKAQLKIAQERQPDLTRRSAWLRPLTESLGFMAEDGARLVEEMSSAITFLAANFRELGSHLESAQQSRALGLHVIRAQEEERRRLAREIHDGPTQLLNSVVLRIDVCQRFFDSDPDRLRDELQQLKELVRLSLQDVRKIIFDLRPMTLDDLGLIPALRTFLKDYQAKTGIETDFAVFGHDRRYDSVFEVAVFRIVQEALTNVSKHAGASRVWVKVETTGGKEIKVSIRDDGIGFDPEKITPGVAGTQFGLVAMRERTELLGGAMQIQSTKGRGTRLGFVFSHVD
jgi:two-component system sensor histidine kinase DegS